MSLASFRSVLLAPLVVIQLSCSPNDGLNPVQGKVIYRDQPLSGALVSFHPNSPSDINAERPIGFTGADGAFQLTTRDVDGARAGKYTVTIICSEVPKAAKKGISTGGVDSVDRLRGAFAQVGSSKIQVEIKPGPNQLDPFQLR